MSANSDNATKECALNVGMDLFIGKPFIMRELQPLLDQLNIEKTIGF
jgi:DNA-binding response OmpR family regulator